MIKEKFEASTIYMLSYISRLSDITMFEKFVLQIVHQKNFLTMEEGEGGKRRLR